MPLGVHGFMARMGECGKTGDKVDRCGICGGGEEMMGKYHDELKEIISKHMNEGMREVFKIAEFDMAHH